MFPRRIPFNQIAFATLLGVGGGIYIYRPMFERDRRKAGAGDKAESEGQKKRGEVTGGGERWSKGGRAKKEPSSSSPSP